MSDNYTQLDEEETACLLAIIDDKLQQIEGDPEVPDKVKKVLRGIREKLSGAKVN